MKHGQLGYEDNQQSEHIDKEMRGVVFGVEAGQQEPFIVKKTLN